MILWHTDTDEFEHGAWFKGRIYEERCDLSADGQLFLYFALQGSRWRTSYKGSWTAVSRPPWLQALVFGRRAIRGAEAAGSWESGRSRSGRARLSPRTPIIRSWVWRR